MKEHIANKSLGQHWLNDDATLNTICELATLTKDDTVLEVGPGLGSLTKELTKRSKHVVAVEYDDTLVSRLKSLEIAKNLQIVSSDILSFDLTSLPKPYKVVANIPYYLTSKLIRNFSESANPPNLAVILVQKEVAERVAAKAGDMSLLSVSAQFYFEVSLGPVVGAKLFSPPPKVDSRLLVMKYREKPLFSKVKTKIFFQIVKAGFSSRRKTLLNSLSGGLRIGKTEINEVLTKSNIQPGLRAQALTLKDWHAIYLNITPLLPVNT